MTSTTPSPPPSLSTPSPSSTPKTTSQSHAQPQPFVVPENKEWHHEKCRKTIADTLDKSMDCCRCSHSHCYADAHVRMLLKALAKSGCPVDDSFFSCKPCTKPVLGYFNPNAGVVICQNFEVPVPMIQETITHELIHAFDICRAKVDANNCLHQACTEIRAAHLSGDCKFSRELARGKAGLVNHMQECVFRRAEVSLSMNERCKDKAAQFVRKAWDVCIKDYEPWSKIPY